MMKTLLPLSSLLLLLCLFSCNKREIEAPSVKFGYEYYPLEVGQFWEYEVDSIIYRPAIGGIRSDTFYSFLLEQVVDTFRDNTGLLNYRVEQFTRRNKDVSWQVRNVFTLSRNQTQAFRVEDNLRFLKMVFPPRSNRQWPGTNYFDEFTQVIVGGNTLQAFKGWESTILEDNAPWSYGDLSFDEVLKIQIADFNTLIERREGEEYYAQDVGLVYKSLYIFDTQCQICCNGDCGDLEWEDRVEQGFQIEQRLIRYQ